MQTHLSADFLSPVKRAVLLLVPEKGVEIPSQREIYILLLGRETEGRALLLHLLLLNCPVLKAVLMPKPQIWGGIDSFLPISTEIWLNKEENVFYNYLKIPERERHTHKESQQ